MQKKINIDNITPSDSAPEHSSNGLSFKLTLIFTLFCFLRMWIWSASFKQLGSLSIVGYAVMVGYLIEAINNTKLYSRKIKTAEEEINSSPISTELKVDLRYKAIVPIHNERAFQLNATIHISKKFIHLFPTAHMDADHFLPYNIKGSLICHMQKDDIYNHLLKIKGLINKLKNIPQINKDYRLRNIPSSVVNTYFAPHCRKSFDMAAKARFFEFTALPFLLFAREICSLIYPDTLYDNSKIALITIITAGLWLFSIFESTKLNESRIRLGLRGFTHHYSPIKLRTGLCLGVQLSQDLRIRPLNEHMWQALKYLAVTEGVIREVKTHPKLDDKTRVQIENFRPILKIS